MGKRGKLIKKKKVEVLFSSSIGDNTKASNDDHNNSGSDSDSGDSDSSDGIDCDMLGGLTENEVSTAIKVVNLLGKKLELFRSRPFKPFRVAIHPLIAEQMRRYEVNEGGGGGTGRKGGRYGNKRDRNDSKDVEAGGSNRGRLVGLSASERLKQMDRDAMNARSDTPSYFFIAISSCCFDVACV